MSRDPDAASGADEPNDLGLVWFRNDLRLEDNPAWSSATRGHTRVAALYVVDPDVVRVAGAVRRRRNAAEVRSLDEQLRAHDGCLLIREGRPCEVIPEEIERLGAASLHLNRNPGPFSSQRDTVVRESLPDNVEMHEFWGNLVIAPGRVQTKDGHVPHVFTSFWKRWRQTDRDEWPSPGDAQLLDDAGDGLRALDAMANSGDPEGVDGNPDDDRWRFGTDGAHRLLERFIDERLRCYSDERDAVDRDSTSELSVALHFGTISPRVVVDAAAGQGKAAEAFIRQVAWRDWYAHLLFENPQLVHRSMRPEYDSIRWRDDEAGLTAWKEGRTGYPIVDAGMRQLAATGGMHNRARLIVASFLVKDLLIDWRHGERHFRHHLLDGDLSQNVGNWQWVAGVGPDAAPYFRIFNPIRQAEAHDPHGEYVRQWVPELRKLSNGDIHTPWLASPEALETAGVEMGASYPRPIVDHPQARNRALASYKLARNQGA